MNKDSLELILEARIKWLKKQADDGKNHDSDFHKEVAGYYDKGQISEQDIIDLQDDESFGKSHVMEISGYITKSDEAMTFNEAREIAQRIQPIYMSYHMKQGRNDGLVLFRESMQPYEDAIESIHEGTYDPIKLAVLQSLPNMAKGEEWDHDLAAKVYHKIF